MITLRQIRQPELPDRWPGVQVAVDAVLEHSSGYTPQWVLQKVASGAILLLEVQRDRKGIGHVFAQIDTHSELMALYLFGVYVRPEERLSAADYRGLRRALVALAERCGCAAIRAKSPRPGWGRLAAQLGFEPVAVEYQWRPGAQEVA